MRRTAYLPQFAVGPDGREIALLWSNTIAFQQLQRLAHGDTDLDTYLRFVRGRHPDVRRGDSTRALCLYASDAEIFDFRPGRFKTEEALGGGEWMRLEAALAGVVADGAALIAPSAVLELLDQPGAGQRLVLESPAVPVPVKKQRKYNLARWAVTGRDNTAINAACQRIYEGMLRAEALAGATAQKKQLQTGLEKALHAVGQRFSHPPDREAVGRLSHTAESRRSKMERATQRKACRVWPFA